jgi:1-phosphofructokinase
MLVILTVTLTPALDKTVLVPAFSIDTVNRIQSIRVDAGGKGINVSKALYALGGSSVATGILGGSNGEFIRDSLDKQGIENDFVFVRDNTRVNMKIIDPDNHTNTDINEPGSPVSSDYLNAVLKIAQNHLKSGDIVVLAGKAPQGTADTLFADWIECFRAMGVKVFLDADGGLLAQGVKGRPALIKPNEDELARLVGRRPIGMEDMVQAAKALIAQGIETVVVSMGGDGALFVREKEILQGHGLKVPVQSTVGAGDSMMAALCYGEEAGKSFEETCRLAMAVSAATVMRPGTQAAAAEDVEALLKQVKLEKVAL